MLYDVYWQPVTDALSKHTTFYLQGEVCSGAKKNITSFQHLTIDYRTT